MFDSVRSKIWVSLTKRANFHMFNEQHDSLSTMENEVLARVSFDEKCKGPFHEVLLKYSSDRQFYFKRMI